MDLPRRRHHRRLATRSPTVVTLRPFNLPAEGSVSSATSCSVTTRWCPLCQGLEFHAGNTSRASSNIRIDQRWPRVGLMQRIRRPAMRLIPRSAIYPDGHFRPDRPIAPLLPKVLRGGSTWDRSCRQVHMPEASRKPCNRRWALLAPSPGTPAMLRLGRQNIDIPAGEANLRSPIPSCSRWRSRSRPAASRLSARHSGHGHAAWWVRPDAASHPDWDYDFQHLYRYVTPFGFRRNAHADVDIPTTIRRTTSAIPIVHRGACWRGPRTADEMGHLGIQVFTRSDRDYDTLNAHDCEGQPDVIEQRVIQLEPTSAACDDVAGQYSAGPAEPGRRSFRRVRG